VRALVTTIPFADKNAQPLRMLERAGAEVVINPLGRKLTESDLAGLIPDFEILIAGTEPITQGVIDRATKLKLIARVGIGLDNVDLIAARRRDIAVSYTPDAPSPAVAELTVGLMIDLLRAVNISNLRMHRGQWYRYSGRRLSEVTIGIIGSGRIGSRVVSHLAGFDCHRIMVNDLDPNLPAIHHPSCQIERTDKERIYQEANVISLHVPLTPATRNLITKREIEVMKPGVLLINTSRGGIINESDLHQALETDRLGGAAIDVFEREPYSGSLSKLDNCLLTAHMGSMSVDCRAQMEIEASEEAARLIRGEALQSSVPEAEYDNQFESYS
jgi:D-3-phosphoglycerate dehydrogenase / 2-oxoglutarate reductase